MPTRARSTTVEQDASAMDEVKRERLRHARIALAYVRQPHITPIVASVVLGPILGLASYYIMQRGGAMVYVSLFTLATLVIGVVTSLTQRRMAGLVLRDVTVSIPEFAGFSFVVNDEHKRVAWRLFVETASRVSTQPLPADQGFLREALTSLYALFATVREELKTMSPSLSGDNATVEIFALRMLNDELRPFLTKWHPLLARFEEERDADEREWERASECREELEAMRQCIVKYAQAFAELAGVTNVQEYFSSKGNE